MRRKRHLKENWNQDSRSCMCFVLNIYFGCLSDCDGFIGTYKGFIGGIKSCKLYKTFFVQYLQKHKFTCTRRNTCQ